MTQKPEVTLKNTKAQIYAAYQRHLKAQNQKRETTLNPVEINRAKQREETLQSATEIAGNGASQIASIRSAINTELMGLETRLGEATTRLETVESAIEERDVELKEVYGIEREAATLASLVEANEQAKAEFEDDMKAARESEDAYRAGAREQWTKDLTKIKANFEETKAELEKKQKRQQDEWKYDFDRQCKSEQDDFTDRLNSAKKANDKLIELANEDIEKRSKAVADREAQAETIENKVSMLEGELEGLKAAKAADIEAAVEDAKRKSEVSKNIAIKAVETKASAEQLVLSERLATREQQIEALQSQVEQLNQRLNEAYAKIDGVATKALESKANGETLGQMQRLLSQAELNTAATASASKRS